MSKKQLLDPLGAGCKLIGLNFSVIDTKININNHVLTLHEPSSYQWIVRRVTGDGQENVFSLYQAIVRIIKWYLVEDVDTDEDACYIDDASDSHSSMNIDNTNSNEIRSGNSIRKVARFISSGLSNLQNTYDSGNVILSIQFLINILEAGLNGTFTDSMLPENLRKKEEEYENLIDYNKLKNLWKVKDLDRICEFYESCFKLLNDEDMSPKIKSALINSGLKSIDSILETTDTDFQKLIQNSNKG